MHPDEPAGSFVTVAIFYSLPEADLAQALLESCGIESFLCDENIHRLGYYGGGLGGMRLQVAEEKLETAQELLKDFSRSRGPLDQSWPAE
jgi:hypothetical protein